MSARQSAISATALQATKRHQAMTTYTATTLQSFIPGLVETLMVEQPADPVSFLRSHLDTLVGEPLASSTDEPTLPSPRATEMRRLREEVAKLRSENEQLLQARSPDQGEGGDTMLGADEASFRACNWNLAGVNENPFEFAASRDERFPRIATFIHDVDTHISQVLFTPDPETDEGEEAQVASAVTESFAAELRDIQLPELLKGLIAVAESTRTADDNDGGEGEEVDTMSAIRKKRQSGLLRHRTNSVADQNWKDVDTDGDGIVDAVAYDLTNDGSFRGLDIDMDGKIDVILPGEESPIANGVGPLEACKVGAQERSLAAALAEIVVGEPPQLLDLLHRGLSSGFFSSPDLKLKDRTWTLTNARPESVKKFLAGCCMCFAEAGEAGVEVDEEIWWQHWLASVCSAWPVEQHGILPKLAFPLAAFDVLLAKIAGRVISKMAPGDAEAFFQEMKRYVGAMRTTSEAKARALAQAIEWTLLSYNPSAIALQEFNAGWLDEPLFRRFWTDHVDGVHAVDGGFEVVSPPQMKNKMQQTLLLIKKGEGSGLTLDVEQTSLLAGCINDHAQLAVRLRAAFSAIYPEEIVELQIENALTSLRYKCAAAVCTAQKEMGGGSLGSPAAMESVLVVGAHAASNGTDNRAIVAAVKELALWLGTLPEVKAVPRTMLMMDANSAAAFPRKGVIKGAASQQVFRSFLRNDPTLSSCWFPREQGDSATGGVHHTVMKERTHLQTQVRLGLPRVCMVVISEC
eukprot:COSAG02_NODE_323_length_24725_cov_57.558272_3_plen_746_part_00